MKSDIEFPSRSKKEVNSNITINLDINDINRLSLGLKLVDAFSWGFDRVNFDKIIASDKETKDIIIKESDLMKIIQMVNPKQKERKIRLISE